MKLFQIVIVVSLLMLSLESWSQDTKVKDTQNTTQNMHSLPKEGKYYWEHQKKEFDNIETFRVSGQSKNSLPIGKWVFQSGIWNYDILFVSNNIRPKMETFGVSSSWEMNFTKGTLNDAFSYKKTQLPLEDKKEKIIQSGEWQMKEGNINGAFSWMDANSSTPTIIKGQTDSNGRATGIWHFEYLSNSKEKITEKHHFKEGLLLKIELMKDKQSTLIDYETNQSYFNAPKPEYIVMGDLDFDLSESKGESSDKYNAFANEIKSIHTQFKNAPIEISGFIPKFRRLKFIFTPDELALVEHIQKKITDVEVSFQAYFENESLVIRSRNESIDISFSILDQTKKQITLIDSLLKRTKLPEFLYKNRQEQGLNHWALAINQLQTARGEVYKNVEASLHEFIQVEGSKNFWKALESHIVNLKNEIQPHLVNIQRETDFFNREIEITTLKSEIGQKYQHLAIVLENENGFGKHLKEFWIENFFLDEIKSLANNENHAQVIASGNNLKEKLNQMELIIDKLKTYDAMPATITSQYTRLVYNPFNGLNDIEMVVKRRFLSTTLENLWPWLEHQLLKSQNWEEFQKQWQLHFDIYDWVMDFANREDAQARRINQRGRSENKPEKLLRIMGF